jgi:hypothetical protein
MLRLPLELRLQIYTHLFQGLHIEWEQLGLLNSLNYIHAPTGYRFLPGLPSWLLTSKQILADGLEELYRSSVLSSCLDSLDPARYSREQRVALGGGKDRNLQEDMVRLLDLRRVRAACIEIAGLHVDPWPQRHEHRSPTLGLWKRCEPLESFLQIYPASNSLTSVEITMTLPSTYPLVYKVQDWSVDAKAIASFPTLEHVHFVVRQERRHGLSSVELYPRSLEELLAEENEKRARGAVLPLLKGVLKGVAVDLVGAGDENECNLREWTVETEGNGLGYGDKGVGEIVSKEMWNEIWKLDWHLDVRRGGRTRA